MTPKDKTFPPTTRLQHSYSYRLATNTIKDTILILFFFLNDYDNPSLKRQPEFGQKSRMTIVPLMENCLYCNIIGVSLIFKNGF